MKFNIISLFYFRERKSTHKWGRGSEGVGENETKKQRDRES